MTYERHDVSDLFVSFINDLIILLGSQQELFATEEEPSLGAWKSERAEKIDERVSNMRAAN